jgi:DNA-binding beta-propeller fold protein YncE
LQEIIEDDNLTYVFSSKWGTFGTGSGQFNQPICVALDSSGNVFVTDGGNHRIQKFTSTGGFLASWGTFGTGLSQFRGPTGIAVESSGAVYVYDTYNNRIQKFRNDGGFIRLGAHLAQETVSFTNHLALQSTLQTMCL